MDTVDRLVIMIALGAAVVAIIWHHSEKPIVGSMHESIPENRINVSARYQEGSEPSPQYLVSNLPAVRHGNDVLPIVGE